MRTLLLGFVFSVVALAGGGLRAQALPEVVVLGHNKRATLLRKLDLSPAQLARVATVLDEERAQRKQRLTHRPNETEHAARLARQADFETKIAAVLTPAQRERYEELRGLRPTPRAPEMQVPGAIPK
ncbi:hypothetical protein E4631_19250 [Hymenobacter sp. UV11]|uniref:hypothetical protein n=1 Tax=Hymenobacter sp. UV11 TaxID=1849735 RepID=UPI00105EF682|nr:hypothetical protein [Hymenobacter sp. UV11]TDN38035.1 hypothetical protein A8B98_00665 [Hymenobacter sp. UV11]TFZ64650.1 hypothetical protein E4631_19250 [Hymenobacter sp. UV11]